MKMSRGLLAAIAIIVALVASCSDSVPYVLSDKDAAYTLAAPRNLKAVEDAGFVYLTWDAVDGADRYAIYRLTTGQSAFKKIGTVDAEDPSLIYEGTSRAMTVGGGNTFLDYVNLDNEFVAGTYQYKVQAQRDVGTEVNTDSNDIRYADGPQSSAISVTIASVPAKGTILPAVTDLTVSTYPGLRIQWTANLRAAYYHVLRYDMSNQGTELAFYNALAQTDEMARSVALWNARTDLVIYNDTENIYDTAIELDSGLTGSYFAVVAVPRDAYYARISYVAVQDLPEEIFGVPSNLETIDVHETEIILEFDAVAGAETYEVWRSTTGVGDWVQLETLANEFELVTSDVSRIRYHDDDVALEAGIGIANTYSYKVRAVAGTGETAQYSTFSNIATGNITTIEGVADFGEIVDLTATYSQFTNKIELTWSKVDGAEEYIIYRSVDGGDTYNVFYESAPVVTYEADETKCFHEDGDVEAGTDVDGVDGTILYYYKVIAVDTNWGSNLADPEGQIVYSVFSNEAQGRVSPNGTETTITDSLAAPSILYNNQGGAPSISIQWTAVNADVATGALEATGYEVYYSTVNGSEYTLLCTTSTTAVATKVNASDTVSMIATGSLDTGYDLGVTITSALFAKGVPYYFMVKSVNTDENMVSVQSNSTVNWLDGLPSAAYTRTWTNPTATNPGSLTIRLSDAVVSANPLGYMIYIVYPDTPGVTTDPAVLADRYDSITVSPAILTALLSDEGYEYTGIAQNDLPNGIYKVSIYAISTGVITGEFSYSTQTFQLTN